LFGAGLSAVFAFALYHLANAPPRPGPHTRSGPTASHAAAAAPSPAPAAPSAKPTSLASRDELVATARASIAAEDDGDESTGSDVLRTRDLKLAPGRSEQPAASSGRAKARAKAKARQRAKARAARKARRSQRISSFGE
jgi:hypothetical protein